MELENENTILFNNNENYLRHSRRRSFFGQYFCRAFSFSVKEQVDVANTTVDIISMRSVEFKRMRIGVKTDGKDTCRIDISADADGQNIFIDGYESPNLNRTFLIEVVPEFVRIQVRGKCLFLIHIWAEKV